MAELEAVQNQIRELEGTSVLTRSDAQNNLLAALYAERARLAAPETAVAEQRNLVEQRNFFLQMQTENRRMQTENRQMLDELITSKLGALQVTRTGRRQGRVCLLKVELEHLLDSAVVRVRLLEPVLYPQPPRGTPLNHRGFLLDSLKGAV